MKTIPKYILATLCLLFAIAILSAEIHDNAGQYGYKFLSVPYGPVSLALASRGSHSSSNATAFIVQPAAVCELDQRIIAVSHSPWLVDTQANCLAYSYARKTNHFGIVLRNLDYGDIENRDDTGYLIGYYNPLDIDVMANYSRRYSPSLYYGVNLGVLYQKLDTATSLGIHSDLGVSWLPPLKGAKLSLAARNLGYASRTNEERLSFPFSLEADYSHKLTVADQQLGLYAALIKPVDENLKGSIGAELTMYELFTLRGGYKLNHSAESFSAGFGVNYKGVGVDYGYAAFDDDLNAVHSFGLRYNF